MRFAIMRHSIMEDDMGYEILVKTGRTVLENGGVCWDKIKTARCQTRRGAEDFRAIELAKNPAATIVIRRELR